MRERGREERGPLRALDQHDATPDDTIHAVRRENSGNDLFSAFRYKSDFNVNDA